MNLKRATLVILLLICFLCIAGYSEEVSGSGNMVSAETKGNHSAKDTSGYPVIGRLEKRDKIISAKEMYKLFRAFIRKSRITYLQVLRPVPLVGTDLRKRLENEGRVFPLEIAPLRRYDGSWPLFVSKNMTIRELLEMPMKLMKRFYDPLSFARIIIRGIAFPGDYLVRGWERWRHGLDKDVIKYGGHHLIRRWQRKQKGSDFIEKLEQYQLEKDSD